jgi:phosphotransferase system HPr (HPr) family protein
VRSQKTTGPKRSRHGAGFGELTSYVIQLRPAAIIVQVAGLFKCPILLSKDDYRTDAKTLIGTALLQVENGNRIQIGADGDEEDVGCLLIQTIFDNFQLLMGVLLPKREAALAEELDRVHQEEGL